jgi:N-acetyl-gamma-glutamyl-phosphate reductase
MENSPDKAALAVGIVGASGYSGELLVHLLARHPHVELAAVTSRQHAGKVVEEVIPSLRGKVSGLRFTDSDAAALAADPRIGLFFLALPHGVASTYAQPLVAAGKKVIDLSADYRLSSADTYRDYYGHPHPDVELLKRSAYVLPEYHEESWKAVSLIAAPGCYPTSILLPLLPLMREKKIGRRGIVIASYSGVSGAGKKAAEDYLYCERAESSKAYGVPRHRHLSEIEEQLSAAAGETVVVQFTPHLAPMRRGIVSTIVVPADGNSIEDLYACWKRTYDGCPFVYILPPGQTPDSQYVVGTNRIDMSAVHDPRTGNFVITSAEDNLMKGAGGQAVQIMNLWFGFPETAGLL